jgi:flagellar basal-body rod protein FlgF
MSDAFTDAYVGLDSRMKLIEIVTNNLANAQTTGFKRDFGRILQSEQVLDVGSTVDTTPGDLVSTGNDLDAAVDGQGFFAIQTPGGVRYTRNGSFSLNESGDLVTKDGMKVLSSSGSPINVSGSNAAIQDGGIVTLDGNEVATLKLVTFGNLNLLQKEGANRLIWNGSADGVQDVDQPRVKSGSLERSNVNSMDEIIKLMAAYREFESVQKTLKTLDIDMNGKLIQELGRIS